MLLQSPVAENAMPMTELTLVVEFDCGLCSGPVAATLRAALEVALDNIPGNNRRCDRRPQDFTRQWKIILLRGIQQLIRPVHRGAECLVAIERAAHATAK